MKFLSLFLLLPMSVFAFDVNFDRANTITETELEGTVRYSCFDNGASRSYTSNCYASYLQGGDYGRVVVSNGTIDADYVKLQRQGSKYIKGATFNAQTGKSIGKFNLWVRSLFQRAMLKRGKNLIDYKFFKNKELVAEGTFEVVVESNDYRSCGYGSVYTGSNCGNVNACEEFFYRRNYCK
jgi:hypothetical protein